MPWGFWQYDVTGNGQRSSQPSRPRKRKAMIVSVPVWAVGSALAPIVSADSNAVCGAEVGLAARHFLSGLENDAGLIASSGRRIDFRAGLVVGGKHVETYPTGEGAFGILPGTFSEGHSKASAAICPVPAEHGAEDEALPVLQPNPLIPSRPFSLNVGNSSMNSQTVSALAGTNRKGEPRPFHRSRSSICR